MEKVVGFGNKEEELLMLLPTFLLFFLSLLDSVLQHSHFSQRSLLFLSSTFLSLALCVFISFHRSCLHSFVSSLVAFTSLEEIFELFTH